MKVLLPYFFLGSWAVGYGWVLDSSCDASGYRELVVDGMNDAFDQASAAVETFAIVPGGRDPVWQAQRDLISYIFSPALTNGNVGPSINDNCEFNQNDYLPT